MNAKTVVVAAIVVAILVVGAFFIGTQQGATVTTQTQTTTVTTTTSSTASTTATSGGSPGSPNGLQLQLSANASVAPSHNVTFTIRVSEFNALATTNNVTQGNSWPLNGLSLGPCGTTVYPFGIALYRGTYYANNASSAQRLQIYPVVACPLLIRFISGYLFQPMSNLAVVLPGGPNAIPMPMSATINASAVYSGGPASSSSTPLGPGTYTIAAGDEWGTVAFVRFTVSAGTSTASTGVAGTTGTLMATFEIGPTQPVCRANATKGPAPTQYSSIQAVITPQPSGQATELPISWVSNGCSVAGSVQASLPPGSYSLNLSSCTFMGCGASLPKTFAITAGQSTSLAVSIDTGIR